MFSNRGWRRRFRWPLTRPEQSAGEVDAELQFHLHMRIRDLMAEGMSEAEARDEALRRFGDLAEARATLTRETGRRIRRGARVAWLRDLGQDLSLAIRATRRRPGVAAVATLILGLGIGLTLAMAAVVNRLVLNPLPWPGSEHFTTVWLASTSSSMRISPEFRMVGAWLARPAGAEWIEAHSQEELLLETGDGAELVATRSVTPGLLPALGARIAAGRGIEATDTVPGAAPVALLAWGTWQRRFGGAPDVIGRAVRLNGTVLTIVGVLQKGFDLTALDAGSRAEFWLPLGGPESGSQSVSVLIKRRPGVEPAALTAELRTGLTAAGITSDMLEKFPPAASDPGEFTDPDRERTLWLLTLAVGLVLAVACANVAALLLGQSAARAGEFRIRQALGAGPGRVVRQLLTEAALLAVLGGGTGWLLAGATLLLTRRIRPDPLIQLDGVTLDPTLLGMTLALLILVALLFGLAPAVAAARTRAEPALGGHPGRSHDSRLGSSLRRMLVTGQLAVSLVLVYGAGLLLRGFIAERNLPVGFEAEHLAWIDVDIPRRTVPEAAAREAIAKNALAAVTTEPGVVSAALSGDSPLGYGVMEAEFLIDGRALPEVEQRMLIPFRAASRDFFATAGKPIEQGRAFDDRAGAREIVIDRVTARQFFPSGDAIGSRIRFSRTEAWYTVVGVVAEQRALLGAWPDGPFVYLPPEHEGFRTLVIRTAAGTPLTRLSAAVRATDSRIRIRTVQSADAALADRLAPHRFTLAIVVGFAGLALVLAAVGLYSVIALAVSQRTWELGVRLALGAAPGRVRSMVLRQGAGQMAAGLAGGLVLMAVTGRLLRGLLSGVPAWDPVTGLVAASVLGVAGLLACWVPAHRASRVDPVQALRTD